MKCYSLFLQLLLVVVLPLSTKSAETYKPDNSEPLDLVIILDDGTELDSFKTTKTLGAARETLSAAIRDEVPFLVSSTVLAAISREYAYLFKFLLNNKQWALYIDSTEEFTIGLPRHYLTWEKILEYNDIQKIGLNNQNLSLLPTDKITQFYTTIVEQSTQIKPVSLNGLKNVFAYKDENGWQPVNDFSRKRLLLFGHGHYEKKDMPGFVAGLTIAQYRDFLLFLNLMNVELLYVTSCYSGGNNLLKAYQLNDESLSKPIRLNYFLIIGAVTDNGAAAASTKIDFNDFFQNTDYFFSPNKSGSIKFEDIINPLWGKVIHNIPSIRFPGSINYFKAVDIDKFVHVITYAQSTALNIPARLQLPPEVKQAYEKMMNDYREGKKINFADSELVERYLIEASKERKIKPPTPITTQAKTVLLYPMQLKTPLIINFPPKKFTPKKLAEVELGKYPAFISMIPGTAAHLITTITTEGALDLRYFVYMFFTHESAFAKLFLIEQLSTKNYPNSSIDAPEHAFLDLANIAIFKNENQNPGIVFVQLDNKLYKAEVIYQRRFPDDELDVMPNISPFTIINPQQAHKELYELILKTQPTQQALTQASGGQENQQEIMQKMLSIFVPSMPH